MVETLAEQGITHRVAVEALRLLGQAAQTHLMLVETVVLVQHQVFQDHP
jgi:hypothetical protein